MPAIVIALASPMIAELLTSSAPPGVFFVPWIFALFVGFYGVGTLLAREAAARWNAGWPTIFLLGCVFGVLEEGLAAKTFFDPGWHALGPLEQHGRALGVNWVWTLAITLFHATYSVALPIVLARVLYPTQRRGPWVPGWGLVLLGAVFLMDLAVFHFNGNKYDVPVAQTVAALLAAKVLVWLARRMSAWRLGTVGTTRIGGWRFLLLGAGAGGAWLLGCFVVPSLGLPAWVTAGWFVMVAAITVALLRRWIADERSFFPARAFALFAGALLPYVVLGPYQEMNPSRTDSAAGMAVVSIGVAVALAWIGRRVRREGAAG
jgi:hypothetical protein